MFEDFITLFKNEIFLEAMRIALGLWPIWLPIIALYGGLMTWLSYKRREWIKTQGSVLLEVKLPSEMFKSPAVMETFIQTLHQPGVGSLADVYLKGRVRQWFSLELVSDGGQVHFYIWMHKNARKAVETNLYALFPNVEVYEVPDYAIGFKYDDSKYKFAKFSHIVLTKPDAYPIKTYVDYGLQNDPKEEYKHDPIAPVIEFLGSLKKGEHAWIQILVQAHTKEGLKYGRLFTKADWKTAAEAQIKAITEQGKMNVTKDKTGDPKYLTETQKDQIKGIERSLDKSAFDTMIRVAYFAEKDTFNAANIGGILGVFKQFGSNAFNGFKPSWYDFDYPWQDFMGIKKRRTDMKALEAYKRRSFFNEPFRGLHDDKPFILTTEEIATLYHFPSSVVVATPTLARIPSKKAEAPFNLPI